jgi:5'-nucleotidase
MENIIIPDKNKLESVKAGIKIGGAGEIHVLADFDRTLTRAYDNGIFVPSLTSILRDGNYLAQDYAPRAQALFDRYHKIEADPSVPFDEKKKAMREWWKLHFKLLVKSGLKYEDLEKIADSGKIKLRDGCSELFAFLEKHGIPLVIMSSSGAGREGISIFLKKAGKLTANIHVISNEFEWSQDGRALKAREPIIYGMNKDETLTRDFPGAYAAVKDRENVILLGDGVSDIGMIKGFDFDHLIKIGFLNERVEDCLASYRENFDIIILNDGPMDYVNGLLGELFG